MVSGDGNLLLEVKKLEVVYNRAAIAIQGVSLKVPEGSVVALLGTNGAGKTTTLRAISGFLGSDNAEITDGEVIFQGEKLNGKQPHEIARRGIVLVPERDKTFVTLTVEENLQTSVFMGLSHKSRREALEQVYHYFPVLKERRHQVAGYLSGGERQMLAIGKALLCSPKLLLVDELSLGLAPVVIAQLMESLAAMRRDLGLTFLVVEQNAAAALKIADYGYIMENGRVVFDGTPERLLAHEDVREFYLGLSESGEAVVKSYRDVKQYRRRRRWYG